MRRKQRHVTIETGTPGITATALVSGKLTAADRAALEDIARAAVRAHLASIGKKGGSVASVRKIAAARRNGKKGGRPAKK